MLGNVKKIHEATMRILARTGVKFHHEDAIKVLKDNNIKVEGNVAYFTEEQLMYWVHKAPTNIDLFATNPKYNITIGGLNSQTAPSSGVPLISDEEGKTRTAVMDDYISLSKLYEVNDNFNISGGSMVFPGDTPINSTTLLMYYAAYTHSDKCLMTGTGKYDEMEALMEMGMAVAGSKEEFMAHPRMMTIINANTPLQLDNVMTETLFTFLKYKQPVVIASAAMAGTTSPMTLAGTIALQNAEVLSTVALAQMFNPGAPVIFGSQTTTADMRDGSIAIGAPEGALCYDYCAQLARFYGLPSRAGGCLSDAKVLNGQAGYEAMMNYLVCRQSGVNLIVHGAGILHSYNTVSYDKVIMDFEIIDIVNRYLRDIEVDEETIPEDVIDEMAHEGAYLLTEHTLDYCKTEPFTPNISVRGVPSSADKQFEINIEKRRNAMYNAYKQPQRDEAVLEKLQEIIVARGVEKEYVVELGKK